MTSPTTWALALVASLAAHASAAALVAAMLHPDPTPDQPQPQSELRIETQEVARSKATQAKPDAPEAASASAKGAIASEGVVPTSRAAAEPLQSTALAAAAPATAISPALPPPQTVLTATAAPPATKAAAPKLAPIQASTATPVKIAATPQPAAQTLTAAAMPATLTATSPLAAEILTTAPDTAITLASTAPAGARLPQAPDSATAVASTPPDLQTVAAVPAQSTRTTAVLAWTGSQAQIDPASLTAIQSFMQPSDIAARSDETHDALTAILTSVPCSRLQAEFNPATGSLNLRGHVPVDALKGPILKALQDQLGLGIKVKDAMLILPRPQCDALSGIADVGLPQSQDQNTNPRLIGADAQARAYGYVQGAVLKLDLAAPDYDAYVYVDYFAADGTVIHLAPNDRVPLKLRPAKSAFVLGLSKPDDPSLEITIGPPYGQEIATAFATSTPLYDGTRPLTEPAAPYLAWLKTRVTEARNRDPGFKGEWVYFFVSTAER